MSCQSDPTVHAPPAESGELPSPASATFHTTADEIVPADLNHDSAGETDPRERAGQSGRPVKWSLGLWRALDRVVQLRRRSMLGAACGSAAVRTPTVRYASRSGRRARRMRISCST